MNTYDPCSKQIGRTALGDRVDIPGRRASGATRTTENGGVYDI